MTYYICRYPSCYQFGRLLLDDTVEGFNVLLFDGNNSYDPWSWGHFEQIDKTHEFDPDSPHYETCEAAWTAFALGSRESACRVLEEALT